MTVTSCPDSRSACERWNPTSPAPATTKYTSASLHGFVDHVGFVRERFAHEHLAHLAVLLKHRVKECAEDRRSGERVDAHLPVGLRAYWIVDLGDDLLQAKDLASDLRCHEVSVVALGQSEERVGALDACLTEHVEVRAVSEDRFALEGGRQV